jgi:hypothetical protein
MAAASAANSVIPVANWRRKFDDTLGFMSGITVSYVPIGDLQVSVSQSICSGGVEGD